MLKDFEKDLIYTIDRASTKIKVGSYLGEFENIKEFEKCIKNTPFILVDFIDKSNPNVARSEISFKIYYASSTYNKDEKYRQKTKFELYDLIEKIEKLLQDKKFVHGFRVSTQSLKKTYEGVSDYGYLSIYEQEIVTTLSSVTDVPELSAEELNFLQGEH